MGKWAIGSCSGCDEKEKSGFENNLLNDNCAFFFFFFFFIRLSVAKRVDKNRTLISSRRVWSPIYAMCSPTFILCVY